MDDKLAFCMDNDVKVPHSKVRKNSDSILPKKFWLSSSFLRHGPSSLEEGAEELAPFCICKEKKIGSRFIGNHF